MPSFEFQGATYYNPVEFALHFIGGKWKIPILWRLRERVWRYGELRADIPGITTKMLTQQLRELEADGFVTRTVYPVIPPHVEYALTDRGRSALPIIEALRNWGLELEKAFAASISS
jgi:DNA-binding HxlR family transcriptional regulator